MFVGFVTLGDTLLVPILVRNAAQAPINTDALPGWRCYEPAGLMQNGAGTCAQKDSGPVQGASNASPVVIASSGHGLSTGTRVTVAGVLGNSGANGTWSVTRVDADHFSLDGSTGSGAYASGGTWNVS